MYTIWDVEFLKKDSNITNSASLIIIKVDPAEWRS